MAKLETCLWFDGVADEAAAFYVSLFPGPDSGLNDALRHPRSGDLVTRSFRLAGRTFEALNGGPQFGFTPAISLFVDCASAAAVDALFGPLSEEGDVLMPVGDYGFSPRFGWLNDRYGLSWQLNAAPGAGPRPRIAPCLMYVGAEHGNAESAVEHYTSLFEDGAVLSLDRYEEGDAEPAGTLRRASFTLAGERFLAMDSGLDHDFRFNEAVSLLVRCVDQAEVDAFWGGLVAEGTPQQCGWLKDRFGVCWQVVPERLYELLQDEDRERARRVMDAMLAMMKIDIAALEP